MSDDLTLAFTRQLAATPAQVWRCWTEPDLIKQWFAPAPVTTTEVEMDARPGGIFRTVMQVPEHGEMAGDAGCVLLAEPERRLVWTNCLGPDFTVNVIPDDAMSFGFTADIQITARDGGCDYAVTVRHGTVQAAEAHAQMGFYDGWGTAADQMEALAKTL